MKHSLFFSILVLLFSILPSLFGTRILTTDDERNISDPPSEGLFDSEEVLEFTLTGNLRSLLDDRSDNPEYHPIMLTYSTKDSEEISIELKSKTRGNFRRNKSQCKYPPLWLNFAKKNTPKNSVFYKQDKIKLVTPCISDKYIIREYLVYKLYNLIADESFRARLVRVVYDDTEKGKKSEPLYGILLEEEDQMAKRNDSQIVKPNYLKPIETNRDIFRTMAVFQYLIGNTDWSVQYRHNIKLIATDNTPTPITVPYDFDHAGIVSTPYARPADALQLSSVRERRYRGFCESDLTKFEKVFALFNESKDDFYRVYSECPLIDEKFVKATTKYLDKFYKTINNPKLCKREFSYPCDEYGTGHVVIQGLGFKEN